MAKKKKSESDHSAVSARVRKRIKRASEQPLNQAMCIYGEIDSGKTRLASSAPSPLIIDCDEKGTDSVRRDYDPKTIRVERWQDVADDIYWYLQEGDHDHETAVIDTTTGLSTLCLNFILGDEASRDASRDPDMPTRQVYGKRTKLMNTLITNYRNLPMNVIFLAQLRVKTSGDDDDADIDDSPTFGPDLSPGIAKHLGAAVGTIGFLQKKEVWIKSKKSKTRRREVRRRLMFAASPHYISKDRNKLFGDYLDAPDLTEMLAMIQSKEE